MYISLKSNTFMVDGLNTESNAKNPSNLLFSKLYKILHTLTGNGKVLKTKWTKFAWFTTISSVGPAEYCEIFQLVTSIQPAPHLNKKERHWTLLRSI